MDSVTKRDWVPIFLLKKIKSKEARSNLLNKALGL